MNTKMKYVDLSAKRSVDVLNYKLWDQNIKETLQNFTTYSKIFVI